MIRTLLRKVLSQRQYAALRSLQIRTIPLRFRLGQSPFLPIRFTIKVLPKRSQVYVKSGINVVEKMDYRRHDIYMAIDSDVEHT